MSDRCWIEMFFKEEDKEKFDKVLGDPWEEIYEDHGIIQATASDVNNALDNDREELAKLKLTFHGYHGAGDNYGSMAFACFEGEEKETCSNIDGEPVIRILEDGKFDLTELEEVLQYLETHNKVREYLETHIT